MTTEELLKRQRTQWMGQMISDYKKEIKRMERVIEEYKKRITWLEDAMLFWPKGDNNG